MAEGAKHPVTAIDTLTLPDGSILTSTRTGTPEQLQELSMAQIRAFGRLVRRLPPRALELASKCACDNPAPEDVKELAGLVQAFGDPGGGPPC